MIRKELKFALPTSLGALMGIASGAFLLFLIVGTSFGLVWGYSDHMLHPKHHKKATRKIVAKKARSSKRKSSRRRK